MALTFTLDSLSPHRMGRCKTSMGAITFDSSFPAAGEPVTAQSFGFNSAVYAVEFTGLTKGTRLFFDYLTQTILMRPGAFNRKCLNPAQAAVALAGGAADVAVYQYGTNIYVLGLSSVVTTLLACETIQPVMSIEKRDADGASNAVELATVTYGATDAVGVVDSVFVGAGDVGGAVDIASALATPYLVAAGFTLALKHKTAGTGAAAAGGSKCHIWVAEYDPNEGAPSAVDASGLTAVRFTAYGW